MSTSSAFPRVVTSPPQLADARARKSFAERLICFGFTQEAATCISDAVVDPAEARKFIGEPENPNFEIRRTPIGIVKGIPLEVWATRVMPDPRNPRTSPEMKHAFAVTPGSGDLAHRYPPIADPRSSETPGAPELLATVRSRDHLAHAHSMAADYIRKNNDWEESIRSQGVMEPIWLAMTTYRHEDGFPDVMALTTVDGSSRLTAVHAILRDKEASFLGPKSEKEDKILGFKSADVPYRGDDDAKFRADIRRMTEWVEKGALSDSQSAILRNLIVPAFLIVGYESLRNGTTFHTAVKSLVAMRHVDPPKPWGPGPEHESLAGEVVDQFEIDSLITSDEANYLRGSLTREEAQKANLSPDPTIRATRILDLFLSRDSSMQNAIRTAVTAQSTRTRVSTRLMKELATVLILRGVDLSPREAEQKRKYFLASIPISAERRSAKSVDWRATGKSSEQLMLEALDEASAAQKDGKHEPGPASVELAVRSVLPLVVSNALAGYRGTRGNDQPDSREPKQVIEAMRMTTRGTRQLGEVLREFADGKMVFRAVDAVGNDVVGSDPKQPVRVGDVFLRSEYPDPGKVATPKASGDQPRDIYAQRVHDLQTAVERLQVARDQVRACHEHDGTLLAEKLGVDYRACDKWLSIINTIAEDLAVWKKADIDYNGRRHDDTEDNEDVLDENDTDDSEEDVDGDHEVESELGESKDQKSD